MSLASAIAQLSAEVAEFKQGTVTQPKEGAADWFLLRAKSLGLSYLKKAQQLALEGSPLRAEKLQESCRQALRLPEDG